MVTGLAALLGDSRLRVGSALELPVRERVGRAVLPRFERGALHEFFLGGDLAGTASPVGVLTLLATGKMQAPGGDVSAAVKEPNSRREFVPRVVYVGRSCWPTFQVVAAALAPYSLEHALFLDPASDAERFWAIGQALRCGSVTAVVADGSRMTQTVSRRLQLAAESLGERGGGGAVAFLSRPLEEKEEASWAASRWEVRPVLSGGQHSRWVLECFSCRRQHAGQDAPRRWIADCSYQVLRGTVSFHLSADVGHRAAEASQPVEQAAGVRSRTA
jgi:hypothetical protein